MEQEISSIEKRFAYGFLQKLLKWMEIASEFIAHLGITVILYIKSTADAFHKVDFDLCSVCFFVTLEAVVSSGRVEKSPHEQEIKFFAKVRHLKKENISWLYEIFGVHLASLFSLCL